MIELIVILLITIIIGMVTNAINIITAEGNLLGFIQQNINAETRLFRLKFTDYEKRVNKYLFKYKPIFLCPPCMSSTWGTLIYWAIQTTINPFSGNELTTLACWPITIITAVFTSYLFARFNDNL